MSAFYEWQSTALLLRVKTQPKSSKDEFCEVMGNCLKVRITAPPVDGKANQHLIKFLARQFRVSKSEIVLLNGVTSREKRFKIDNPKQLPSFISPANSPVAPSE